MSAAASSSTPPEAPEAELGVSAPDALRHRGAVPGANGALRHGPQQRLRLTEPGDGAALVVAAANGGGREPVDLPPERGAEQLQQHLPSRARQLPRIDRALHDGARRAVLMSSDRGGGGFGVQLGHRLARGVEELEGALIAGRRIEPPAQPEHGQAGPVGALAGSAAAVLIGWARNPLEQAPRDLDRQRGDRRWAGLGTRVRHRAHTRLEVGRGRRVTQGVPRQPGQAMQGGHGVRALPFGAHLPVLGQTGLQEGEQLLVLAAETEAHRVFDHDQIQLSRELRPCCGRFRVCRLWARLCCGGDRRAGNRGLARLGWDPIGQEGVRERSVIPRIRRPAAATPGASRGVAEGLREPEKQEDPGRRGQQEDEYLLHGHRTPTRPTPLAPTIGANPTMPSRFVLKRGGGYHALRLPRFPPQEDSCAASP